MECRNDATDAFHPTFSAVSKSKHWPSRLWIAALQSMTNQKLHFISQQIKHKAMYSMPMLPPSGHREYPEPKCPPFLLPAPTVKYPGLRWW